MRKIFAKEMQPGDLIAIDPLSFVKPFHHENLKLDLYFVIENIVEAVSTLHKKYNIKCLVTTNGAPYIQEFEYDQQDVFIDAHVIPLRVQTMNLDLSDTISVYSEYFV